MNKQNKLKSFALAAITVLLIIIYFESPGTGDVRIWTRWLTNSINHGFSHGYELNRADYPPISSAITYIIYKLPVADGNLFLAIKLSIAIFLIIAIFIYYKISQKFLLTAVLIFALFPNSILLSYTDIYYAGFLILAVWHLQTNKQII